MDGSRICCYHGIQRVGYLSCDLCIYPVHSHCIMVCRDYAVMHCDVTVKLPHFLPVHEESEPVYPTWGASQAAVQGADERAATWFRYCKTQMCGLRTDRAGWSKFTVPFLFEVRGQLWVLSGSPVYTSAHPKSIRTKIQSFSRWRRKTVFFIS